MLYAKTQEIPLRIHVKLYKVVCFLQNSEKSLKFNWKCFQFQIFVRHIFTKNYFGIGEKNKKSPYFQFPYHLAMVSFEISHNLCYTEFWQYRHTGKQASAPITASPFGLPTYPYAVCYSVEKERPHVLPRFPDPRHHHP